MTKKVGIEIFAQVDVCLVLCQCLYEKQKEPDTDKIFNNLKIFYGDYDENHANEKYPFPDWSIADYEDYTFFFNRKYPPIIRDDDDENMFNGVKKESDFIGCFKHLSNVFHFIRNEENQDQYQQYEYSVYSISIDEDQQDEIYLEDMIKTLQNIKKENPNSNYIYRSIDETN